MTFKGTSQPKLFYEIEDHKNNCTVSVVCPQLPISLQGSQAPWSQLGSNLRSTGMTGANQSLQSLHQKTCVTALRRGRSGITSPSHNWKRLLPKSKPGFISGLKLQLCPRRSSPLSQTRRSLFLLSPRHHVHPLPAQGWSSPESS